jgi:hypothetical protein
VVRAKDPLGHLRARWAGQTFHSEHRPLHDYVDALADAGFLVERLREVGEPDPESKWYRIPLFLHILAVRS